MMKIENDSYQFILGDCLTILKEIESESINCVITSPPYWGMRRYANDDNENEVGNETSFDEYLRKMTMIFDEVKRVLTPDGSLWLNLGDKYDDKALVGMPWRVALALMDKGGWILRNDVIWNQLKGTQSCKDRLRDSYEHIFHFVKSKRYYYDADSIRITPVKKPKVINGTIISSTGVSGVKYRKLINESPVLSEAEKAEATKALDATLQQVRDGEIVDFRMTIRGAQRAWHSNDSSVSGRAKELEQRGFYIMRMGAGGHLPSDIWNIVTEDTWRKDNHCAVFPEELLRIPILATSPIGGYVLDPFSGTGSTIAASVKLGRKGIGIELSEEYVTVAKKRLAAVQKPLFV